MKILSIDVGLKRIGVAFSPDGVLALPKDAIIRKNRDQAALEIRELLSSLQIELLVVGLPKGGASEDEMDRRIRHFVSLLSFNGQIVYVDEYGSSHEAKELLPKNSSRYKDGKLDSLAAMLLLERFLSNQDR